MKTLKVNKTIKKTKKKFNYLDTLISNIQTNNYFFSRIKCKETDEYTWDLITVNNEVTGNCQLCSIGYFKELLECLPNTRCKQVLKKIFKTIGKNLALVDVNSEHCERVEKIFKKEFIVFKQEYTSTNGSFMCIYMIKIKEFSIN